MGGFLWLLDISAVVLETGVVVPDKNTEKGESGQYDRVGTMTE